MKQVGFSFCLLSMLLSNWSKNIFFPARYIAQWSSYLGRGWQNCSKKQKWLKPFLSPFFCFLVIFSVHLNCSYTLANSCMNVSQMYLKVYYRYSDRIMYPYSGFFQIFSGFRQCYKFSRIWLKQNWFMCYWKSFRFFQFFLFPQMIFNASMFSFV